MSRQPHAGGKQPRCSKRVMVRCLGLGKEHYFPSTDRTRNRICPQCDKKMGALNYNFTRRFEVIP